jgi:3-oxocholest-4-en-26-oyl-CoA dehydrogenase alpha subunit
MSVSSDYNRLLDDAHAFASGLAAEISDDERYRYQGMPSDGNSRHAYERMGAAGWIGLHWPERLGGRGMHPLLTDAMEEVFGYHWLPMCEYLLSVKTIGNALLRFAAPSLVDRLLPEMAAGRLIFCQGFSEPDAGSDLASLRTSAKLDGDLLIINGRKLWTSGAENADWVYLAVRTDPHAARHRGLSVLVADMRSPGIEIATHRTLGGGTLGELAITDLVVPVNHVVGELHGGWQVLMGTMDFERVTTEKVGVAMWLLESLESRVTSAAERRDLRRLYGQAAAARLHGRRATRLLTDEKEASVASSMAKLAVARLLQQLAEFAVTVLGPTALLEQVSGASTCLEARVAAFYRAAVATTIAGGTAEIQRRVIAHRGLVPAT